MSVTTEKPTETNPLLVPSARQQVSNRSILRIQELSNDLCKQLERMDFFRRIGGVRQVLFVANDHLRTTPTETWYNFRLCATFVLDDKAIGDLRPGGALSPGVEALFRMAKKWDNHTSADYQKFLRILDKELQAESPEDQKETQFRELALDQLLIALAVVPYQGVLVSLLEKAFFDFDESTQEWTKPKHKACFIIPEGNKPGYFTFRNFDAFQQAETLFSEKKWDDFEINLPAEEDKHSKQAVEELFEKFLLPFTRGAVPTPTSSTQGHGNTNTAREDTDIYGFAVPAFDEYCPIKGWRGGMAGWLVVFLNAPKAVDAFYKNPEETPELRKLRLDSAWAHFTDLVRTYVRRVREANIRDLLEDYADPEGTHEKPREFFLKHLHQVIGYRRLQGNIPKEAQVSVRGLEIPSDNNREQLNADVIPLPQTCWDKYGDPEKGTRFPPGTRRLCAMFLDELDLVRAKREEGHQTGIREDRETHEFMWAHETRKLSRALIHSDEFVVRDLIGRHLVSMTYPAKGDPGRASDQKDLEQYWPPPFSVRYGSAKDWMNSIHDFSARRWALTSYALEAAIQGRKLAGRLDEFCESSRNNIEWSRTWDDLQLDTTFPGPARKFFTRLWLAAFSNYFKHLETLTAKPPCKLEIIESDFSRILLIKQSNILGKPPEHHIKKMGTKDILLYDLLNAARWRNEQKPTPIFGAAQEQDLIGMVRFEAVTALHSPETLFITQVPIPENFFRV